MAKQTRTILKGYFETGDTPSQAEYIDFIDSKVNLSESNTGDIELTGDIQLTGDMTASNNISASGTLIANEANIKGHITASGNISASGTITAEQLTTSDDATVGDRLTTEYADVNIGLLVNKDAAGAGDFRVKSVNLTHMIFSDANKDRVGIGWSGVSGDNLSSSLHIGGDLTIGSGSIDGHITSSGNISASGYISAYGSSSLNGLPTSVPSTTGSLWVSGSNAEGTSKYLMVFTG